ncbi:T9SS type A sorting domain-containing protein, partial [Flavobacteriales bacterium]|nr:T9SS type A sorting domain-containing protein [Flavobacteriales bacterium]
FLENENSIVIYPNPAKNQLNLDVEFSENHEFNIINIFGEIVVSGLINAANISIDISSLPPNIYFLRIAKETLKFIKID